MSSTTAVKVDGIEFERSDLLGCGGFGSVHRGKFKSQSVAVKKIMKINGKNKVVDNELKILQQLNHPNIVKFVHYASDADFYDFALELCDASLDTVFLNEDDPRKYKGPALPNNFEVFSQIATGLKHIHSENLIHRDIKPENILISVKQTKQGNDITIKLADFGLSRKVSDQRTFTMSELRGTLVWFSPEEMEIMGRDVSIEKTKGSHKSDVYAEGLLFGYILLKGKHIYGENPYDIVVNMKQKNLANMSEIHQTHLARNLIEQMLNNTPDTRIISEEVVNQLEAINIELSEKEKKLHQLSTCPTTDCRNKIESLMQLGVDLNAKDDDGWNALHLLCSNDSSPHLIHAIQLFIELGIDKDAKINDGSNALHLLCSNNSSPHLIDAIKLLIELGIDKNAKTNYGSNALHLLCSNNSGPHFIDAIKLLIKFGIDKNAKTNDGWNALHLSCEYSSSPHIIDAIKLLIELGIDKNAKTFFGWNAYDLSRRNKNLTNYNLYEIFKTG
ncbi:serine/threonine-protein kinase/endoribonuclease IRE1-like [Daphnia carinata]|uniref:serine/threonine-protein kinase/endoribonuclease IRE1-like n=1 Tax=Daphnia carinata TaxID=120202 RepID=UPI00257F474E|nr:serine/threonine-protein kinase/endoribonuclease IRE1-like [Daphnia carinata]